MAYCILKSYKLKTDPFRIFELFSRYKDCFFLDSALNSQGHGRYSFLGIQPFLKVQTRGEEPFKKIRAALKSYHISFSGNSPPFLGGAVGYLAYDFNLGMPDCVFGFYNSAVIIDHAKKLLYLCTIGFPEKGYRLGKVLAESNFKKLSRLVCRAVQDKSSDSGQYLYSRASELKSNFQKKDYLAAVERAKEYISRGDIYQVNLSQRFETETPLPGVGIYRRLRRISPAPFGAYFAGGDFEILSSSPERFLSVSKDRVVTRPMKGTRGRSTNKKRDTSLKRELLTSSKDKAELVMIVDLERNDLGRVCSYDSIKVTSLRTLEAYNTVYQTTATVEGRLHEDKDRIDLLRACFPGGSITGCPKIRAMEIIQELEPTRRSVYTGALGYLSFSGNMDFNILIRTILKKKRKLYFGVGGGIVADSDPEAEYAETLLKARAMVEAIS
ncbi:MAG: aminodeoxychorismate synthase component I [Candidatus Omnitrophota bacterium]|jgi:para-aminobenzoate synthetase component 1